MKQEYARVSVEMPENEDKKSLHQELTYEIENRDINEEYMVTFYSRGNDGRRKQKDTGRT